MLSPVIAKKKEWFGEWFDSPYYHVLYQHRDNKEARQFIDNLVDRLQIKPNAPLLDLCCGRGRHAIYLNQKGFDVTGLDLSPQNIRFAHRAARTNLRFAVHDMREVYAQAKFEVVLNLFTSFGYFDDQADNLRALAAMKAALKPNGYIVLDFLNPDLVRQNMVTQTTKRVSGITFDIKKYLENDWIVKQISFEVEGQFSQFFEKVRLISEADFGRYFTQTGLKIVDCWGDYQLKPFEKYKSERMIFLLQTT